MIGIDAFLEQYLRICEELRLTDEETTVLWSRLKKQAREALLWLDAHPNATMDEAHVATRAMTLEELARAVRSTTHGTPIERTRNVVLLGGTGRLMAEHILSWTGTTHETFEQVSPRSVFWDDTRITSIELPRTYDRTDEAAYAIRAADGRVCIIDASNPSSWNAWPRPERGLCFISGLDHPRADHQSALETAQRIIGDRCVLLQVPFGQGKAFLGFVDLVHLQARRFGRIEKIVEIPEALRLEVIDGHQRLLQMLRLHSRAKAPGIDLKAAIRAATIAGDIIPLLYGGVARTSGMRQLLDAVVDYLPSPLDAAPVKGVDPRNGLSIERSAFDEPFAAQVFKIIDDEHLGKLAFFRVYSGRAEAGQEIEVSPERESRRIVRLLQMHDGKREEIEEVRAGDIAALLAWADLSIGTTLSAKERPIVFGKIALEPEKPIKRVTFESFGEPDHKAVVEPRVVPFVQVAAATAPQLQIDEQPLEVVYARYFDLLAQIAVHKFRVPSEDAESLARDVLIAYFRKTHDVHNIRPWLIGGICHASRSYWRQQSRPMDSETEVELDPMDPASVRILDSLPDQVAAREALECLTPRCREILSMRYFEGCTVAEVAQRLGLQPKYAQKLIQKCLRRIATAYQSKRDPPS